MSEIDLRGLSNLSNLRPELPGDGPDRAAVVDSEESSASRIAVEIP